MSGQRTVLVVEDEEDLLETVTFILRRAGYEVIEADNGLHALERIAANGLPDLILLDMNMPVMNGWELARQMRARELWRVPVVVFTAAHDAQRSADEIGAAGFLGKPFDLEELVATVTRHLPPDGR
jgi:two-component system phosphate regulon response regulator PhoB